MHRTPHLANGMERAFLLHMRTHDAVASKVAHRVEDAIHIRTNDCLIHQVPQETSCTTGIGHHQLPIVLQASSMTTIIESVQELGRHEDLFLTHILCCLAPRTIVLCLETITISPRIEHHALLDIELRKYGFQLVVEATLVAVAPENDRRVIHVARHHLFHNLRAHNRLMCPMPARLFALYIKAQRVAGIQKLRIGRIVRQSHRIHIHRLDEQHVLDVLLLRQRASALRTE